MHKSALDLFVRVVHLDVCLADSTVTSVTAVTKSVVVIIMPLPPVATWSTFGWLLELWKFLRNL